jgi:hypothetical protein
MKNQATRFFEGRSCSDSLDQGGLGIPERVLNYLPVASGPKWAQRIDVSPVAAQDLVSFVRRERAGLALRGMRSTRWSNSSKVEQDVAADRQKLDSFILNHPTCPGGRT